MSNPFDSWHSVARCVHEWKSQVTRGYTAISAVCAPAVGRGGILVRGGIAVAADALPKAVQVAPVFEGVLKFLQQASHHVIRPHLTSHAQLPYPNLTA